MTDSYISTSDFGTTFAGPDAVQLFRAMQIRGALKMWKVGLKVHRGVKLKDLLGMVSEHTGKTYKKSDLDTAIADLVQWIEAMKAALPVEAE
jgi:hypothetical protein